MADKSISELVAATQVTPTDLFVLEQASTAKKLTGQTLENWLVSFADGHGGIQSITYTPPVAPSLVGTLAIVLADETTYSVNVTNGNGITSITGPVTSGLTDTYTINFTNGTTKVFTVTNGEKGDTGDASYVWIKWAGVNPSSDTDITDLPDDWIGVYSGTVDDPDDLHYTDFKWFLYKGDSGDAATIAVGTVTTLPAGSQATVVNAGTSAAAVFNFGIPKGADGEGVGDMTKEEYDSNSDGKVDSADEADHATSADTATNATNADSATNASKLENHPASYFATAAALADYAPIEIVTTSTAASATIHNHETVAVTNTPTALAVTLDAPVSGKDFVCGLNFKAGTGFALSETAPSGWSIVYPDGAPTWSAGKVYEIIYRALWVENVISAKYSEVTLS